MLAFRYETLLLLWSLIDVLAAVAGVGPVSIPPNTNWDGNDGLWSSFTIQLGTPPQAVRVLPSTSGSSVWAILAQGCTPEDPPECPNLRGGIFEPNSSSTWTEKGIYTLPLEAEKGWGLSGNGQFAFDDVTLSYAGGGGPQLNHTIFAGIASKDFFIGTLGLAPHDVNFTDYNYPVPSILTSLKTAGYIDSMSWAYTAGAYYTPKQTYASLTFGGYDASRFTFNNLSLTRGLDVSRDLLVGVQSIASGTDELLPEGIIAMIDSTIAQIWLPLQACLRFEEVFGLVWDEDVQLYLVNDTLHDKLVADDPVVTFTIGSTATSRDIVNIKMPYGSFDLTANWPLTPNGSSRYFPVRRAANESQYLLGRAFLQAAYLTVDYDRNNFSVSQALFPDMEVAQNLIAITPPSATGSGHPLGTRLIAGTSCAVGVVVIVLIATLIVFLLRKRRARAREKLANSSQTSFTKPELGASAPIAGTHTPDDGLQTVQKAVDSRDSRPEIDGVERRGEWVGAELHGRHQMPPELSGQTRLPPELTGTTAAAELPHWGYIHGQVYEVP